MKPGKIEIKDGKVTVLDGEGEKLAASNKSKNPESVRKQIIAAALTAFGEDEPEAATINTVAARVASEAVPDE